MILEAGIPNERLTKAEAGNAVTDDLVGSGALLANEFAQVLQGGVRDGILDLCEVLVNGSKGHFTHSKLHFEIRTTDGPPDRPGGIDGPGIHLRWDLVFQRPLPAPVQRWRRDHRHTRECR